MTVTVTALLLAVCACALAGEHFPRPPIVTPIYNLSDAENIYQQFLTEHSKVYGPEEYKKRYEIFKESLHRVNELNAKYRDTAFTIYHFADLTKEERDMYTGLKVGNSSVIAEPPRLPAGLAAPAAFDWRDHGAVSPVKSQGPCAACYVFSAIANIEGQQAIKHKQCIALSEQQCIDCLAIKGCHGGVMHEVMQFLAKDKKAGCMKEADYPYRAQKEECKEDKVKTAATVVSGGEIYIPDEDVLLKTLYKFGPLAVGIDASDLYEYGGGILSPILCKDSVHHAVTLVGYGEENGKKFWIIKNSWGEEWGEKGYVRLERGVNACRMGTAYTASAVVA